MKESSRDFFLDHLRYPDKKARVKTRWWWFGCKVNEHDIVYQLDQMQQAGIGAVEIQITYPLQAGEDNYEYFSPGFFRMLQFTSQELKKRDMTMDLTLGSSWPFGGPFIPFKKSAVHVVPLELTVEGPAEFEYDFTNRIAGEIIGCVMGKMKGSRMLPETVIDLRPFLTDKLLYEWPWGIRLSNVQVPEGVWKIVVFVASQFREHVLMPTRGAEGYVVDHNNKEAVRFFLEHAGTPVAEKLGRGAIDNFFCDSLEVFGCNWANGLYEEFEKRRGYDLHPYIYALWGEVDGLTDKIRYDFHHTLSELTVEGFFREMTDWCHEVGSTSRIQAHGTWGDVLLSYAAADVPEGETFSAWDKFSVNTVHRRLAASAGHLYGRPVISNESFTWLRFPRFTETLEQIKIAADSIFVDGINQIVNHGYAWSPDPERIVNAGGTEQTQGEELFFYASSAISHPNTWWKFYPHLARYMHRVSAFLQMGEPYAQICIYLPQADIWAENPLSDVHMCMKIEEKIETKTVDAIAQAGYWFDYINDDAIQNGSLTRYEALVIMETDRMPAESAAAIREYARKQGLVICAGKMPSADCGKLGKDESVKEIFKQLLQNGQMMFAQDKHDALLKILSENVTPDLSFTEGSNDIGYIHRKLKAGQQSGDGICKPASELTGKQTDKPAGELYFVANMSRTAYRTTLKFGKEPECMKNLHADGVTQAGKASPTLAANEISEALLVLDPLTGEEVTCGWKLTEEGLSMYFPEGQSYILILRNPGKEDRQERLDLDQEAGPECRSLARNDKNVLCRDSGQKDKQEYLIYGRTCETSLPKIQRFYEDLWSVPDRSILDLTDGWMITAEILKDRAGSRKTETDGTGSGIVSRRPWSLENGFEQLPELKYYSGEVAYTRELTLGDEELSYDHLILQAESIEVCAAVLVNDVPVTDWIMKPYLADIRPFVRPGVNTITIKASNLLINRFLNPEKKIYEYPDEIMDEWPYFPQQLIKERGKRLDRWRELEMVKEPLPSGMIGKVRILLLRS